MMSRALAFARVVPELRMSAEICETILPATDKLANCSYPSHTEGGF